MILRESVWRLILCVGMFLLPTFTHADDLIEIKGRVVLKENPKQGVPEAKVYGRSFEAGSGGLEAVSDASGRFRAVRGTSEMLVHAATENGGLAGIVKLGAEDAAVEIPVSPTATARGRLVGGDKPGEPLIGRQLEWGVRIEMEEGTVSTAFGGNVITDEAGEFTIAGLVPGWKYTLSVVIDFDARKSPRSWRQVGSVTPAEGKRIEDLGDVALKVPAARASLESLIDKQLIGGSQTPAERIKAGLRDARISDQRLLLVTTSRKQADCREFFAIRFDLDRNEDFDDAREALANFALLAVDTADKNFAAAWKKEFAARKLDWPGDDETALAILNLKGMLVASTTAKDLSTDGKLSPENLAEFLHRHAPEFHDARKVFADALIQAKREDKRLFVQHSGAYCPPCLRLSRYVDANKELLSKDYVYVKLDHRYENGRETIERVRSAPGGIPWTVILDTDGRPLISSDGPDGNIGYPGTAASKKHFEKMLRDTAKRLTAEEIGRLLDAIDK